MSEEDWLEMVPSVRDVATALLAIVGVCAVVWKLVLPHFEKAVKRAVENMQAVTEEQGQRIAQIHQATTVNHHSSAEPTIPDRLSDAVVAMDKVHERVDTIHSRQDQLIDQLGDVLDRQRKIEDRFEERVARTDPLIAKFIEEQDRRNRPSVVIPIPFTIKRS